MQLPPIPEVLEPEAHVLPVRPLLSTQSTLTSARYSSHRHWREARARLYAHRAVRSLDQDLRLYGTSNEFTDMHNRYKPNIDELITVKSEKKEHFRVTHKQAEEEEKKNDRWILRSDSLFKKVWDQLIALTLMYTATIMPYRVAFEEEYFWSAWVLFELVLDGIFIVDIGVNFHSEVTMDDGTVETDRLKIASIYLKSWFIVDLMACLPFTIADYYLSTGDQNLNSGSYNNIMRLSKLPRLYKLLRVARLLKAARRYQSSGVVYAFQDLLQVNSRVFKLVKFLLYVMISVHLMACVWFFAAKMQNFGVDCWVVRYNLAESSTGKQYLSAIYFSITTLVTVGYGDVLPVTSTEQIVVILWMIIGVGFYSFTVGSLSSFLSSIDTRESALALKLATVNEIAHQTGLPNSVRAKVRQAVTYGTSLTGSIWSDKHSLFNELPKTLRFEVATSMYGGVAKTLLLFKDKDQAFINQVMPLFRPLRYAEATYLYREGEYADEVYFITFGRANMVLKGLGVTYKSYLRGSYLGEIEVLKGLYRLATCKVIRHTELLRITKFDFLKLLEEFPAEKRKLDTLAGQRMRKEKQAYVELLELIKLRAKTGSLKQLEGREQLLRLDTVNLEAWETQEEKQEKLLIRLQSSSRELTELSIQLWETAVDLAFVLSSAISVARAIPNQ